MTQQFGHRNSAPGISADVAYAGIGLASVLRFIGAGDSGFPMTAMIPSAPLLLPGGSGFVGCAVAVRGPLGPQ